MENVLLNNPQELIKTSQVQVYRISAIKMGGPRFELVHQDNWF